MNGQTKLTSMLLAAVVLAAVVNLLLFYNHLLILRTAQGLQVQAQQMQAQVPRINHNLGVARAMAAEALEQGRRNPAMMQTLQAHAAFLQRLDLKPETPPAPGR
jgi:hypothetical protein